MGTARRAGAIRRAPSPVALPEKTAVAAWYSGKSKTASTPGFDPVPAGAAALKEAQVGRVRDPRLADGSARRDGPP